MKVLMLTTGFPRFVGDLFGSFVSEQAHALSRCGVQVSVLAPHEKAFIGVKKLGRSKSFAFAMLGLMCSSAWPMGEAFPPTCGAVGGCVFRCTFSVGVSARCTPPRPIRRFGALPLDRFGARCAVGSGAEQEDGAKRAGQRYTHAVWSVRASLKPIYRK